MSRPEAQIFHNPDNAASRDRSREAEEIQKNIMRAAAELDPDLMRLMSAARPVEARAESESRTGWGSAELGHIGHYDSEHWQSGVAGVNWDRRIVVSLHADHGLAEDDSENQGVLRAMAADSKRAGLELNAGIFTDLLRKVLVEKMGFEDLRSEFKRLYLEEYAKLNEKNSGREGYDEAIANARDRVLEFAKQKL